MLLDGEEWQSYFRTFQQSAFRLEVHQVYTMPTEAESVQAFLAGMARPDDFNAEWHRTISGHRVGGRTMTRAKVITMPLTDYSRYLFDWCIPGNVAAGEDYRIVDLSGRSLDLPKQDFWMFDDEVVVHLNYRVDGTQVNRELISNPNLSAYRRWRDLALAESVSFTEWNSART
ncbi:DUF6879 family protein [Streptomyces sp. CBMA156]|uniref:DUF6879 family protein n=1 Tax=Streptomyces sp. CBMA156 TaxID=1930280 RepID=UPI0016619461|nr:DUF6879 family protein [Streptomyces sp. CBMA156]MBD0674052.1 hypothetical protein [Streptomyces sp. CBMA156]